MKYRWGFVEGGVFTECKPVVEDDTSLDFSQQSGAVFYRAKLNGSLLFRFAEFDSILSKGYNYEHIVVLQYFDNDLNDWGEVWRGRFALTDCEVDYDTQTISVTPETQDRYTKILEELDTEYNLVKLAPQMQPVSINIRPCIQTYITGADKIANTIGGSTWEASCDTVEVVSDLQDMGFNFAGGVFSVYIKYKAGTGFHDVLCSGIVDYTPVGTDLGRFYVYGRYWDGADWVQVSYLTDVEYFRVDEQRGLQFQVHTELTYDGNTGIDLQCIFATVGQHLYSGGRFSAWCEATNSPDDMPFDIDFCIAEYDRAWCRIMCNTALDTVSINGTTYTLIDVPTNDIMGQNLNYNKLLPMSEAIEVDCYSYTDSEPTEWGECAAGGYFLKLPNTATNTYYPCATTIWDYVSIWVTEKKVGGVRLMDEVESKLTAFVRIKDSYKLNQTVLSLLRKANWTGTYFISGIFGTQDYAGYKFYPVITPKSNVITSYYDTPAQKAPISLAKIFSMLKQAYKIYWYIDENDNIHLEHISYFDNGLKYTEDTPQVLADLEIELHTNTKSNKVFGQNKIKYDKQDMPAQYTFSWMDKQTDAFDGWPIKCLDSYVQKDAKDEKNIGDFSSDVDFIISNPNDVSKDGFVLFALPIVDGNYLTTLRLERLNLHDENGEEFTVVVQNAEAANAKIHENMWRYSLPCENVNINNEDTVAKTTGRYKVQTIEFADTVMTKVLKNVDNCNWVVRTQQGDGHIKTLSINLNSLAAKADLLFNFVGRWYYLRGTALGNSIVINFNGESVTIEVSANKFIYRYSEPITSLTFGAADVVSVDFADCDGLESLTSCDNMFDGCEELIAVDFDGKTFSAVTSANNMFRGCTELTTLICPDTSTWKADLDFSDCPDLTLESFYDLIKFLYYYNAGVHTITPNATMWNSLDADTQNDLIAKATERGWTIGIPAAYSITGQSAANTVYAIINGSPVEISVVGGSWHYDYNGAIISISFENDADVTDIDFSLSDGLAGVTSLNDAFKNCAGLTTVDFTNCDLSNVASASDAFAGCTSLYELIIPDGTWKPDVDLSDGVMPKPEMLNVINGLYVYTSGTHTITFNQTIWDAMSVADQQIVFDAADAKGWTTNAVSVVYYVRGTSSNINGQETFNIQYINDGSLTPNLMETVTVNVDANGDWEFSYDHKTIYSLNGFAPSHTTLLTVDFSAADDLSNVINLGYSVIGEGSFSNCTALTNVNFSNCKLTNCQYLNYTFYGCSNLLSIDMGDAILGNLIQLNRCFESCTKLVTLDLSSATFASVTRLYRTWQSVSKMTTLKVPGNSTAVVPTSTPSDAPVDLHWSILTYQSMLDVANWLSDLTGYSVHTCTFKSSVWNALSAAEQSTIDGILSGKNWTRAIA